MKPATSVSCRDVSASEKFASTLLASDASFVSASPHALFAVAKGLPELLRLLGHPTSSLDRLRQYL